MLDVFFYWVGLLIGLSFGVCTLFLLCLCTFMVYMTSGRLWHFYITIGFSYVMSKENWPKTGHSSWGWLKSSRFPRSGIVGDIDQSCWSLSSCHSSQRSNLGHNSHVFFFFLFPTLWYIYVQHQTWTYMIYRWVCGGVLRQEL
jgi:hypothetical protein